MSLKPPKPIQPPNKSSLGKLRKKLDDLENYIAQNFDERYVEEFGVSEDFCDQAFSDISKIIDLLEEQLESEVKSK